MLKKTNTIHDTLLKNYTATMIIFLICLIVSNMLVNLIMFNGSPKKLFNSMVSQTEQKLALYVDEITNIIKSAFYNQTIQLILRDLCEIQSLTEDYAVWKTSYMSKAIAREISRLKLWFPQISNVDIHYLNGLSFDCVSGMVSRLHEFAPLANNELLWEVKENTIGDLCVYLSMNINDVDNLRKLCSITVELDSLGFLELLNNAANPYGELFMVSNEETIIANRPIRGMKYISDFLNENSLDVPPSAGAQQVRIGGLNELVYCYSSDTKWYVCGFFPYWEFTKRILFNQGYVIIFAFILLFIFIYKNYRIGKSIIRDISLIQGEMRKVEHGIFEVVSIPSNFIEIENLSVSLNRMFFNLKKYIEKEYITNIQLKEAKFNALQSQVNPHFIYNTLETIHSELWIKGENEIASMVTSLAELLRYSTSHTERRIFLHEEIAIVEMYLSIQKIRFADRLHYNIDLDSDTMNCRMPKFLIQPIVENAVLHGIEPKMSAGIIEIKSYRNTDGDLFISVTDNGEGIPQEKIQSLLETESSLIPAGQKHTRVGICNIHNRIRLLFGAKYGIQIESELNHYTRVIIRIPTDAS